MGITGRYTSGGVPVATDVKGRAGLGLSLLALQACLVFSGVFRGESATYITSASVRVETWPYWIK